MKISLSNTTCVIKIFSLLIFFTNSTAITQSGPYLGQTGPGVTPTRFAIGKIPSTGIFGFTFSPDGKECFFGNYPSIMTTKETNGGWPNPAIALFSGTYGDVEPTITPDGNRLYFSSERPPSTSNTDLRLWYVDKTDAGWSAPRLMSAPLGEISITYPSLASNGNFYYTGNPANQCIFVSKYVNGNYQTPERLSDSVNIPGWPGHPFIAPDESYLIFDAAVNENIRDLFICFKKPDGTWTKAINLGRPINTTNGNELCPFVSRNGKYFFFSRGGTEFWVDASFIEKMRPIPGLPTGDLRNSYLEKTD